MVPVADEAALQSAVAFVSLMVLCASVGIWIDAQHATAECLASHVFCAAAVDGHVILTVMAAKLWIRFCAHTADMASSPSPSHSGSYTDTGSPTTL